MRLGINAGVAGSSSTIKLATCKSNTGCGSETDLAPSSLQGGALGVEGLEEAQLEIEAGPLSSAAGIWGIDVDQHKCLVVSKHHPATVSRTFPVSTPVCTPLAEWKGASHDQQTHLCQIQIFQDLTGICSCASSPCQALIRMQFGFLSQCNVRSCCPLMVYGADDAQSNLSDMHRATALCDSFESRRA